MPAVTAALICLTLNLYMEARGEDPDGQYLVADVTLNRVASELYPDTVCDVVFDPHQFSWTSDPEFQTALSVAREALSGPRATTATHYYAHDSTEPFWAEHEDFKVLGQYGGHTFLLETRE